MRQSAANVQLTGMRNGGLLSRRDWFISINLVRVVYVSNNYQTLVPF